VRLENVPCDGLRQTLWYTGLVAERYERHPNVKCKICGKPVYRRPGVLKNSHGNVFCSRDCYGVSNRIEIPCLVCGRLILKRQNKKTCSRSCANIHRTGIRYKLGAPRKDRVRGYRQLKTRLIEQRGGCCEICGYDKELVLQVHHIDRDHENNRMNNLRLLCPNCHYEEYLS